jgi:hypothetical protein
MATLFAYLGSLALAVAAPAFATDEPQPSPPTSEELAAVELALERGQTLYEYDQAAWHTTDAMREDMEDLASSGIVGWVVTPAADGWLVTYWRREGDSFAGVYSAVWSKQRVRQRKRLEGAAAVLSAKQLNLIAARNSVDDSGLERCADVPFNTVVIPERGGDPILVYLLTPQTSTTSIPAGGHYRFTVRDGEVVEQRSFTKSCLELEFLSPDGDGRAVVLGVSHLLDPVPTEIHVFSMFAAETPIFVMTPSSERVWSVEASGGQARVSSIR